jgi:hypothetical protein
VKTGLRRWGTSKCWLCKARVLLDLGRVFQRHTRHEGHTQLRIGSTPWTVLHPPYSLVHLLKRIVVLRFKLAHRTVIGIYRNLFFVVHLKQGGLLLHDLGLVSHQQLRQKCHQLYQRSTAFHRLLLIEAVHLMVWSWKRKSVVKRKRISLFVYSAVNKRAGGWRVTNCATFTSTYQYFSVRRSVASAVRCAKEHQTEYHPWN